MGKQTHAITQSAMDPVELTREALRILSGSLVFFHHVDITTECDEEGETTKVQLKGMVYRMRQDHWENQPHRVSCLVRSIFHPVDGSLWGTVFQVEVLGKVYEFISDTSWFSGSNRPSPVVEIIKQQA